jgi:PcRGLX-like protein central beta sandwich domain
MMFLRKLLLGLSFGMILLGGRVLSWEIDLELREHRGAGGLRYVSGGIPLLPGQASEVSQLRLARKIGGKLVAVPAQFRVLARWWRSDKSIRWVLVDFQTDIKAKEKLNFVLTDAKLTAPSPEHKLTVTETAEAISINTGVAVFSVPKKKFAFLQSAVVGGQELLATTPECGTVLTDTYGEKYYSSEKTRSVTVIEKGSMRIRIRARGLHTVRGNKGYSKGMYSYDFFMDFFAGSSTVISDVIIGNNFPKSVGAPTFDDASLLLKLKAPISEYTIAGGRGAIHSGKLQAGTSTCLNQDSNGADSWEKCPGVARMTVSGWKSVKQSCSSFRGYKVYSRQNGAEDGQKEIAKGDQAVGTTTVKSGTGGLLLHLRNFWQQFPKGVEVFGDGRVRLALFPGEYKVPHFLEDAGAKGHEVIIQFYKGKAPNAKAVAAAWDSKVFPRPAKLEHCAATGALADLGPYTTPVGDKGLGKKPNNRTEAYGSRMLSTDRLYGNAYGWQVFGERWRSNGGHSKHGARQPMDQDNYLYRWFSTGVHGWLLNGDARSRLFRDVRCYRIEDVEPLDYKDWSTFKTRNRSEDWTRRSQPKDQEIKKFSQGIYGRTKWWLPNPAHMTLDLLYDRYLLMGDQRSFENMRTIAAHGGFYSSHYKNVHRATGWSMRACYRYWELTGDKKAEALLKRDIANFKGMVDAGDIKLPMRGKTKINWWFTFVFSRAVAMTALHTRDKDALHVLKRMHETIVAKHTHSSPYRNSTFSEVWAVLYHLTGDEKVKQGVLGGDDGAKLKRIYGGMCQPASAHWLLHQKPVPLK